MQNNLTFEGWNNILFDSFIEEQVIDGRIEKIVLIGEPEDVLSRIYARDSEKNFCSKEEIWNSFCNAITEEHFRPTYIGAGYSNYPSYMPQLFASIVAATADSDSINDGNFRTRLSKKFNLTEKQIQNLSIIPIFWNAFKRYLASHYKDHIDLVLPNVGRETQIGISKSIVVPTFLDSRHLSLLLNDLNEKAVEDLLVYDKLPSRLISDIYTDTPYKFSKNLKDECKKNCQEQSNLLLSIIKQIVSNIKYLPYYRSNDIIKLRYIKKVSGEEYIRIYRHNSQKQYVDIDNELVTVEKFLSGELLNNIQLSKILNRQLKEEGLIAFVAREDMQHYEYSPLLPSHGRAILFIHASTYCYLESNLKIFVLESTVRNWVKIKIDILSDFKNKFPSIEELQNKSMFRLWLMDSIYLRGYYIAKIKKYLFSKYYHPLVSSNQASEIYAGHSNNQSIKCTLEYVQTNNERFIYKFPQDFRLQIIESNKKHLQPIPITISDSKKKMVIDCFYRVPDEIAFDRDIKRPLANAGLAAEGLCGSQHQLTKAECSGINSITFDEKTILMPDQKSSSFFSPLISNEREIEMPILQSTDSITKLPDERESEFYEALAVRSIRKTGINYADICELIRKAFPFITDYQCYLSITTLIERGVLERFYHPRCSVSVYFARSPQAYYTEDANGNRSWKICGLLTMGMRKSLENILGQNHVSASIQYISSNNSKVFFPSGMICVKDADPNLFDGIMWLNIQRAIKRPQFPNMGYFMEQFSSLGFEYSEEQDRAVWNSKICKFEKAAKKENTGIELERINLHDRYAVNRVDTNYIITYNGKQLRSRSRTWSIILYSLLAQKVLFQTDGENLLSKGMIPLPIFYARYINLAGGISGSYLNKENFGYLYSNFTNILNKLSLYIQGLDTNIFEHRFKQKISARKITNNNLTRFRRRAY